ncbi:hypothetical protein M569_11009, partial [Genlisea aurea]
MPRSPVLSPESGHGDANAAGAAAFHSIRDRFPFKRYNSSSSAPALPRLSKTAHKASRSHHHHKQKLPFVAFVGKPWFYFSILTVIFTFSLASMVLQKSFMPGFGQTIGAERTRWRWSVKEGLKPGSSLKFVPGWRLELNESRLDWLRTQPRIGVRRPRISIILSNLENDVPALMLYSVMKILRGLGYVLKVYALEDGESRSNWQAITEQVSILSRERYGLVDWSIFEGIIVSNIEAKNAFSSLMQEPFCSVPLIWIVQSDALANRLLLYEKMGWEHLSSNWKRAFSRADALVFSDYSFPMLYRKLDTGNFFVIPGSPLDFWAAEKYARTHSKSQLRQEYHFDNDDLLVLVVGSSLFYSELAWDYALGIHDLEPLLRKYAQNDDGLTFKFMFLFGNSSQGYGDALQDFATRLRLSQGSLLHYGLDSDVNGLILMADIVLYASSQDEQGFPPILTRAMSFGIPTLAADYPIITKYVSDRVHGVTFAKGDPEALTDAFSLFISEGKLSKLANSVASSGKLHAKNMFAAECIIGYAKLLERVFDFPSDVLLSNHPSQLNDSVWEWSFLGEGHDGDSDSSENLHLWSSLGMNSSIFFEHEEGLISDASSKNVSHGGEKDALTNSDWIIMNEMENSDEVERLNWQEVEERMGKGIGEWADIYRNARKSEKIRFETNERDEGELERTGQLICIYEMYNGQGGWPFLHHGSLYRGLSLTPGAQRLSSDDVDAVVRLPILNDTYYREILCEIGGMFSIANGIDEIHKRPWIGFQSWHARGRKQSLSPEVEELLDKTIKENVKGDVIYFWASLLDMDAVGSVGNNNNNLLTFWSTCDIMNAGRCRTAFESAFRRMYGLP